MDTKVGGSRDNLDKSTNLEMDTEAGGSRENLDKSTNLEMDTEVSGSCENLDKSTNLEMDSDENNLMYTPQVSDELRPKKGQQFDTIDDVVTFYNAYAKAVGFSVRAWTTKKEQGSDEIRRNE